MKDARIFIVEDDYVVAKNLSFLLESLGYQVKGMAESGEEGLSMIQKEQPDLVILDIDLAGALNGIELGKMLKELQLPFIYVSAHADEQTMSEALPTEPWAYLAKPFNENTLRSSIELALYKIFQKKNPQSVLETAVKDKKYTMEDAIFIKTKNRLVKVALQDILFIEANDIYANVYTRESKYLVNYTLKAIAEKFPEKHFLRVHRSYLVNRHMVEAIEYNDLLLNGHRIPVGKTYREELMRYFEIM